MTIYTIETPDEQEPCITAAREAYNQSIPALVWDNETSGYVPNPDLKPDNTAYMTWVMQNAANSYCMMYYPEGVPPA